jgi:hypothetical protein
MHSLFEMRGMSARIRLKFVNNCGRQGVENLSKSCELNIMGSNSSRCRLANLESNQATILVCIVADETAMKSMMIVQRSTAELELFGVGHILEQMLLAYRESGFIDTHLFIA